MTEEELSLGEIDRIIRQLRARYQDVENKDVLPLRTEDCRALMRHIAQGKPLPDIAQDWLQFCYARAAEGESLDRLLGVPPGRPRKTAEHLEIAVEVVRRMKAGATLETAAATGAEKHHQHEQKIRIIYSKHKKLAELCVAIDNWIDS